MTERTQLYEIVFAQESEHGLIEMAASIVNAYAEQGLMLSVTLEKLQRIAAQGMLAVAVNVDKQVIGAAGITFEFPDGKKEFGGWAVHSEWIHSGVGKQLLHAVLQRSKGETVVAFGNHNSGPIFKKLGAKILNHADMDATAFVPCQSCACKGKEHLGKGELCVDTIFDLSAIEG